MFDVATAAVRERWPPEPTTPTPGSSSAATSRRGPQRPIESLDSRESAGVGVRALIGSSWGFFATADWPRRAPPGREAAAIARASAACRARRCPWPTSPSTRRATRRPVDEDPFAVSLAEKGDLLVAVTETMHGGRRRGPRPRRSLTFWDTEKWFVSSQGHRIHQHLVECGGGMDATAVGRARDPAPVLPAVVRRSTDRRLRGGPGLRPARPRRPDGRGGGRPAAAPRSARAGTTDLVLESAQLALQIHESVGHAIELDRILGWEAAFAGTSFLDLAQLGTLRYGSRR